MSIKQLAHRSLVRCLRAMQDLNSVNGVDHHVCPWHEVHRTPHCVLTTPIGRCFHLRFGRAHALQLDSETEGRDLREERDTGREEDESMRLTPFSDKLAKGCGYLATEGGKVKEYQKPNSKKVEGNGTS